MIVHAACKYRVVAILKFFMLSGVRTFNLRGVTTFLKRVIICGKQKGGKIVCGKQFFLGTIAQTVSDAVKLR